MDKKIFSIKKFCGWAKKRGYSTKEINGNLFSWANACEGLTKEEMYNIYRCLAFDDVWFMKASEEKKGGGKEKKNK